MKRILIFDAQCSTCSRLAKTVQKLSNGKLSTLSIFSPEAKDLLSKAYPNGWKHAPYLVLVDQDNVRAWTGIGAGIKFIKLLGLRNAWYVWGLARKEGVTLPGASKTPSTLIPRRQLLKAGLVTSFLVAFSGKQISTTHACIPCDTCGIRCEHTEWCYSGNPACPGDGKCDRYDCYDTRTGEHCGYVLGNCCCNCRCA